MLYEWKLKDAKKYWKEEAREEGLAEGLAEGRAQGHAQGHAEGHAQGHAEGKAASDNQWQSVVAEKDAEIERLRALLKG